MAERPKVQASRKAARRRIATLAGGASIARILLVASTFASVLAGACASLGPERPATLAPLEALNILFRQSYRDARARTLSRLDPVILISSGHAALIQKDRQERVRVLGPRYHALKSISHLPLAAFVLLSERRGSRLPPAAKAQLARLLELAEPALDAFRGLGFDAATVARQQQIVGLVKRIVAPLIDGKPLDPGALDALGKQTGPLLLANATAAAAEQLDAVHALVSRWRRSLSQTEWSRLRVVIIGAHMARTEEICFQYFSRLLGESQEGRRIVYAESLWQERDALELAATHELDREASVRFFGDVDRLHRDLLADGAKAHLVKLFGR